MPSFSATTAPRQFQSMGVTENKISFSSPSTSKHLPASIKTPFEEGMGSDPDTNSNASSFDVSEAQHVNSLCAVAIQEDEDASQVLLIPHTSPFFSTPRSASGSDYSSPSVCPTLGGKFDLVHSAPNTPSSAATRDQVVSSGVPGLLQRRRARISA